jgi:signal transduction histidine kinase
VLVRIEVTDTGPGIPKEMENEVFRPFVRGRTTSRPGVGLGLATVKRIVEAYGGRVGVLSSDGGGSRFWFTLPRAVVTRADLARQGPRVGRANYPSPN